MSLSQERNQVPIHTYPLSLTACCKCLGLVVQPSKLGQPTSQGPMLVDDVQKFIGFDSNSISVVSLWIFHHIFIFFSSYRASPFICSNIPTSESSALARPGFAAPSHIESPSILLWNIWMGRHGVTWVILKMTLFIDVYSKVLSKVKPQYLETHPFVEQICWELVLFSPHCLFDTRESCQPSKPDLPTTCFTCVTCITIKLRMTSSTVSIASINAAWIE